MSSQRRPKLNYLRPLRVGRSSGDRLVVLYHGVSRLPRSPLEVSLGRLERQVHALLERGYTIETVTRALEAKERGERIVAITFDDGDASIVDLALPLLDSFGARATAFLPSAEPRRLDVRPLLDNGWEIGSHGHRHVELTSLTTTELERELSASREAIAAECGACTSIAYPYSAVDIRVIEAARRVGFVVGCTTATTPALGPLAWPRVGIGRDDGTVAFLLKTSRAGRRVRRSAVGSPIAAVARASRRSAYRLRHR
jgi:peptidoglycan/xylan/chitin deacetylase (PgdA/CDA1 family)